MMCNEPPDELAKGIKKNYIQKYVFILLKKKKVIIHINITINISPLVICYFIYYYLSVINFLCNSNLLRRITFIFIFNLLR